MSIPIASGSDRTAPTPQNTPLSAAPISQGISRPTVPDISEEGEEGIGAIRESILGSLHGRLDELAEKNNGYINSLPLPQKVRLQALKGVQTEQDELNKRFELEVFELEKKYHGLRQPLLTRRNELVHGLGSGPTKEEIEKGEAQSKKENEEDYTPLPLDSPEAKDDGKGIPDFWLTVLKNHLALGEIITDKDEEALKSLKDIQLSYLEGTSGFKLSFHFATNDFFENTILDKTYTYKDEVGYWGDLAYEKSIGTEISWKEDKNLTKTVTIKKQRNKNTNQTRLVKKSVPVESFFNFFDPPQPLPEDEIPEDSEDEDLDEKIATDYQLGEDLKDKIIPKATDYFTGIATTWDLINELSDMSDGDDSFDEEEDDEDDD